MEQWEDDRIKNWKGFGRKWSWIKRDIMYFGIWIGSLRKMGKHLNQVSRCPD
jgi:hypothetical protein